MATRREFVQQAALLMGAGMGWAALPASIRKAFEIDPSEGTTYLDAEHVVILMQENRSFDHCFATLQGVRGLNDPRAHIQPDGNLVWLQTGATGATYVPFRLDMNQTNATWLGSLPHSWPDQVDARNGGRFDRWLHAKPFGMEEGLPRTLSHYTREDLPFYYALADAFTVCDQHFCSSLTGTTPNRLFLWSGNLRADAKDPARVQNADTDYGREAAWTTFPERLQKAGVSWRVYQNEISLDSGFVGEEDSWLGNFTDNPLEWFSQYGVRFAKGFRANFDRREKRQLELIASLEKEPGDGKKLAEARDELAWIRDERSRFNDTTWAALTPEERELHEGAFSTNEGDPDYRSLAALKYQDGAETRELQVPKGDVLHRFREDVESGQLPAVSWLVAPEHFSDHPDSAWYGAWYVSEILDILTKNPEVWKKTVFILTYDENDGFFDHVPPFVAPFPDRPETGKASEGIDTTPDVVYRANEPAHRDPDEARESPIGLGFRVPMVVASPWSRGGCVNSQVFDHTSVLRFLEVWLNHKGKPVRETNITDWRRTVSGDLTSIFRPYKGEKMALPNSLERDPFLEKIHRMRFMSPPTSRKGLTAEEMERIKRGERPPMAAQEPGTRPSCPLPYELTANGKREGGKFILDLEAGRESFGKASAGCPFTSISYLEDFSVRSYAVAPGKKVQDALPITGESYHVRIDGPNGFMRKFKGKGMGLEVRVTSARDGKVKVAITNEGATPSQMTLRDESYGGPEQTKTIPAKGHLILTVQTAKSHGWYDFTVRTGETTYRYAGRVETGKWSITDPAMGTPPGAPSSTRPE